MRIPHYNSNGSYIWKVDKAILLPGNITVLLDNCTIQLSDSCRDNMFRSGNVGEGITSPGWLTGGESRKEAGLIRGGPSVVVTTKGVLRFRPTSHEAYLASYHPGLTAENVSEETGFTLDTADAFETPIPTAEELHILRNVVDPERIFLK